jgi:DNA-binding XRE family transcriptional regulator
MNKLTTLALAGLVAVAASAVASDTRLAGFGASSAFIADVQDIWSLPAVVASNKNATYFEMGQYTNFGFDGTCCPSQNDPKRVAAWERRRQMVGTRIQGLRMDRGLTQEQLAQLSGVSRNVLMDVEHGRRGILHERLFDIAKALDVSAADLLDGIH